MKNDTEIARDARETIKKLGMTFSIHWDNEVDQIILSALSAVKAQQPDFSKIKEALGIIANAQPTSVADSYRETAVEALRLLPSASGDNPAPTNQSLPSAEVNPRTANHPQVPLPCPFCGGRATLVQQTDTERPFVTWVACEDCNCMTDDVIGEPKEKAAQIATDLWNKRVPLASSRDLESTASGLQEKEKQPAPQEKSVAQQPQKEGMCNSHGTDFIYDCPRCRFLMAGESCEPAEKWHFVAWDSAGAVLESDTGVIQIVPIPIPRELIMLLLQATPTPWASHANLTASENHKGWDIHGADGNFICEVSPQIISNGEPSQEGMASRELIVAAVNFVADLARREKEDL